MNASRLTTFLAIGLVLVLAIAVGLSLYIVTQPLGSGLAGAAGAAGGRTGEAGYNSYMLVCEGTSMRVIFKSMQGPGVGNEVVENRAVGDKGKEVVRLNPGKLDFQTLVLKRTLTNDSNIWNWRKRVIDGQIDQARQNCSIRVLDAKLAVFAEWELTNAWPSAYGVEMTTETNVETKTNVETNETIEVLTVVYEGLNRTK
jgi:phage tail-like protein